MNSIELCKIFVPLIDCKRFSNKSDCSFIFSAISKAFSASEEGYRYFSELTINLNLSQELLDLIDYTYKKPKENKTVKTLAWFARLDSPDDYFDFINSSNCLLPEVYRKYWLDWVCYKINIDTTIWYHFSNQKWVLSDPINKEIQSCEALMDEDFKEILDSDCMLTGTMNGCLENIGESLILRDSIPEDFISSSTNFDFNNFNLSDPKVTKWISKEILENDSGKEKEKFMHISSKVIGCGMNHVYYSPPEVYKHLPEGGDGYLELNHKYVSNPYFSQQI